MILSLSAPLIFGHFLAHYDHPKAKNTQESYDKLGVRSSKKSKIDGPFIATRVINFGRPGLPDFGLCDSIRNTLRVQKIQFLRIKNTITFYYTINLFPNPLSLSN
jgi:hypothetical protein